MPAEGKSDMIAGARAVLRESVRIITLVLGTERVGDARRNAWASVVENRDRAQDRDQLSRLVAAGRDPRS